MNNNIFIGKGTLENALVGKNIYGNVYSTTETVIGQFNGKPLYRKYITVDASDLTGQSSNINHGISNLGIVVDQRLIWERTNGSQRRQFPSNYYGSSDWSGQILTTDTYIALELGSTLLSNMQNSLTYCYIILEYTKTTD